MVLCNIHRKSRGFLPQRFLRVAAPAALALFALLSVVPNAAQPGVIAPLAIRIDTGTTAGTNGSIIYV